jgi:amino acid transporter
MPANAVGHLCGDRSDLGRTLMTRDSSTRLIRTLSLTHVVLYGIGVTVGAGIYVLIGAAAARAGMHAPVAFLIAALLMALSALSFAELASRMPVAASEAAYVQAGLRSRWLSFAAGLLVIAIAVISAAAISLGSAGYVGVFVPLPQPVIVVIVVMAMGAIAAWGIKESVVFAGIMTAIEVGGLLIVVVAGLATEPDALARLPEAIPSFGDGAHWFGIFSAGLLAVFAFIGFEGIVNVAEEVQDARRTVPRAIFITLAVTTVLYMAVVWVALVAVGPDELGTAAAPLALVFERTTGVSPLVMSAIAVVATLNGIIVQIIMASRVGYGLADQGKLPAWLAIVHPKTRTPVVATAAATALVLLLALAVPLEGLADATSRIALVMFALINLSLAVLKWREREAPADIFRAPVWAPWAGLLATVGFLVADVAI